MVRELRNTKTNLSVGKRCNINKTHPAHTLCSSRTQILRCLRKRIMQKHADRFAASMQGPSATKCLVQVHTFDASKTRPALGIGMHA